MKNIGGKFRLSVYLGALGVLLAWIGASPAAQAQTIPPRYEKPSKPILDVLEAPPAPELSVSPAGDVALSYTRVLYPPIAELARPMLRLAGLRMDPANYGQHNPVRFMNFSLLRMDDGHATPLALPASGHFGAPIWAPDGKHFALIDSGPHMVQLWIGDATTGAVHAIPGFQLNTTLAGLHSWLWSPFSQVPDLGAPCRWMPGSRELLCVTVPSGRGGPPEASTIPTGPRVLESSGKAAPERTFEDLLQNEHDQELFDYYATSRLEFIDIATGHQTPVGSPGIFAYFDPAPDGKHLLVERIYKPYSYLATVESFPRKVEVESPSGQVIYWTASLPLEENVPIGGVATGPRNFSWDPTAQATLVWVEALDDGDPRKKTAQRDKLMWVDLAAARSVADAPKPVQVLQLEQRFAGIAWGERGDLAIVRDIDPSHQVGRAFFFNPKDLSAPPRLVWDLPLEDRYRNPGLPVERILANGQRAIVESDDSIYLEGEGASPEGDRPFLDRFDVQTLKSERIFHSDAKSYESFEALLAPDGTKFVTRHEAPSDPPNYFLRTAAGETRPLTHFADPTPQLRDIHWQQVTYQREDGVGLSMKIYYPRGYKPGTRYPAVLWAYPREYVNAAVASQVVGSPNRFLSLRGAYNNETQLFFLLDGYIVLDNVAMPVVGNPETVNDTYAQQIVADAKAAIEKATELGVIDPHRVGVAGHSYGAFMTANLLAHSDLFRAGVAESGAYNRTLTPFGFQNERRTLWQATQTYVQMSPFMFAEKIKAPILLIHGEADDNPGTFPIQSDRMYRAIKGNGGTVRYVTLPDEAHVYQGRETMEDVLWEGLRWFDLYVKNAKPAEPETPGATP